MVADDSGNLAVSSNYTPYQLLNSSNLIITFSPEEILQLQ